MRGETNYRDNAAPAAPLGGCNKKDSRPTDLEALDGGIEISLQVAGLNENR
jgi:hypothetical protein